MVCCGVLHRAVRCYALLCYAMLCYWLCSAFSTRSCLESWLQLHSIFYIIYCVIIIVSIIDVTGLSGQVPKGMVELLVGYSG